MTIRTKCKILDKPPIKYKTGRKRNPWIFCYSKVIGGKRSFLVLPDKKKQNVGTWSLNYIDCCYLFCSWRNLNVTADKTSTIKLSQQWEKSNSTQRNRTPSTIITRHNFFVVCLMGENDTSIVLKTAVVQPDLPSLLSYVGNNWIHTALEVFWLMTNFTEAFVPFLGVLHYYMKKLYGIMEAVSTVK